MSIPANIEQVQRSLPSGARLVAVTKNRSPEDIEKAIAAGVTIIGENKIQEAKTKFPQLKSPVKKHFIGHLQRNKAKIAVELFDMIESVDSLKLAKKINQVANEQEKIMPILLQINIAKDPNKHGFDESELAPILKEIKTLPNLDIRGLMAIVPYYDDPEEARPHFQKMYTLKEEFDLKELSMGMTNDYLVAIKEGATLVRIGRALFE